MKTQREKRQDKPVPSLSGHVLNSPGASFNQDQRLHAVQLKNIQEKANQFSQQSASTFDDNRPQTSVVQRKNQTGLPDSLKAGIENLSGYSMDDVRVHYHSSKPAQLQAHAYAQGNQIHLASGQEKHLPHEAWHVVQQKQGRVKPTLQLKQGVPVNDDQGLEREADVMGARAMTHMEATQPMLKNEPILGQTAQRVIEVHEKDHPGVLAEMTRLIVSKDKTLEEINVDPNFKLIIMDNTANMALNNIGGVVNVNGLTKYIDNKTISVVVNFQHCKNDMGKALRILSHEVNVHAVNGYEQIVRNRNFPSQDFKPTPEEIRDHVKILNLTYNKTRSGPIIDHRKQVIKNLVSGLYLDDFTDFYNSWRAEINSLGRESDLIEKEWKSALLVQNDKRTQLQKFVVESLGTSGNMSMIILEAKKAATAVCEHGFNEFLRIATENSSKLTERDKKDLDKLSIEFEKGRKNDNPEEPKQPAEKRESREGIIKIMKAKGILTQNKTLGDLAQSLGLATSSNEKELSLAIPIKIKKKVEASILVSDELLAQLKNIVAVTNQGNFSVFVSKSEYDKV